ncbi:ATPase, T2SS/T4P/T4SS family (plasmid) [Methylomarinum sp. Ch1-1]|uniref:ATPase, T2SS/T4P/T4SS family n=1 Tax=Methylomarinum roseum TaxID=3067653 RepID=A0AAU7P0I1_9GAMM|nr:ATPase, T2SS/T4P/T4SS family [Methylomarinum sp. Ch1-1]MDP4523213.1 ATPase, T2SS/T4P/T4SS family [Methylomarinum sp. Ch1-1]
MTAFTDILNNFVITDAYCSLSDKTEKLGDYVSPGMTPAPDPLRPFLDDIKRKINGQTNDEFSLRYEGEVFRCSKIKTVLGDFLRLRRLPTVAPDINKLGIPSSTQRVLLSSSFNSGGLIAVVGMPGQGKSTTCAATLVKRLKKFGGMCITLEDPAEIPLQGRYNNGICLQIEVSDETGYAKAIKKAMKDYPAKENLMLYVGEVRDGFAAKRMLDAANDGRLVLTTFHAKDILSGLERIIALASSEISESLAKNLLASSLRAIIFQSLENNQVRTKVLINTLSVSGYLQSGKIKQISSELDRQENLLKRGMPIEDVISANL